MSPVVSYNLRVQPVMLHGIGHNWLIPVTPQATDHENHEKGGCCCFFLGISQDAILGHVCIISWLSFCLTMALLEMAPCGLEVSWIAKRRGVGYTWCYPASTACDTNHTSPLPPKQFHLKIVPLRIDHLQARCIATSAKGQQKGHCWCQSSLESKRNQSNPKGILYWLFSII